MSIITTPRLQRLWQDARTYPEWATTRLWEYIFNHMIFSDDKWVVSSQQPPTHQQNDLRRVDLVVERFDNEGGGPVTLLFLEAKRGNADASAIEVVEYQAFTAACAHYAETGKEQIWTMTCFGSAARLWIFNAKSDYLIPFVPPSEGLAEKSEYLELSTDGTTIVDALKFIKKHITPPSELLLAHPTSRPAHASLPEQWHDQEVQQLDWQRSQTSPTVAEGMGMAEDSSHDATYIPQSEVSPGPMYAASSWGADASGGTSYEQPNYNPNSFSQGDVGGSSAASNTRQQQSSDPSKGQDKKEVEVTTKVNWHKMNPIKGPEVEFKHKGVINVTPLDRWVKIKGDGRSVWVYEGKKTKYWTRRLD